MENPWLSLPEEPPYVLPSDQPQVDAFNLRTATNQRRTLRLNVRPEPYIGSINAPIVLLYLNPGYTEADIELNVDVEGQRLWRNNLRQTNEIYPFYLLDPSIEWAPGPRWWRKTLRQLLNASDVETVARKVLCIEYFPYHSVDDPGFPGVLPSQAYSFTLVDRAINRGAAIFVARSLPAWREQVPRLNDYQRLYRVRSPQNSAFTAKNYPEGFEVALDILRR